MARVTVEDCIEKIPNRFELVILAAERTKNIASGAILTVERDNDKNPVIALREIATGSVEVDDLRVAQVASLQKNNMIDEVPEENLYAEAKDSIGEEMELSPDGDDNMFSHDLTEIDLDFDDNITEEDEDK